MAHIYLYSISLNQDEKIAVRKKANAVCIAFDQSRKSDFCKIVVKYILVKIIVEKAELSSKDNHRCPKLEQETFALEISITPINC